MREVSLTPHRRNMETERGQVLASAAYAAPSWAHSWNTEKPAAPPKLREDTTHASYRRCSPAQTILSALQRYNRLKSAHLLRDLAAAADLPPQSALFSMQHLDLAHSLHPEKVAFSVISRSGSSTSCLPTGLPADGNRRTPRQAPAPQRTIAAHRKMSLRSIASWGQSITSMEHTRGQLGSKSSSSASPCGSEQQSQQSQRRSSHWFLPTYLLMVHTILLTYTFGTTHSLRTRGPVTWEVRRGFSLRVLDLSPSGGSALEVTTSARCVWHAPPHIIPSVVLLQLHW